MIGSSFTRKVIWIWHSGGMEGTLVFAGMVDPGYVNPKSCFVSGLYTYLGQ